MVNTHDQDLSNIRDNCVLLGYMTGKQEVIQWTAI